MALEHPQRILFLGHRDSRVSNVIKDLTGIEVTANDSLAGQIYTWHVETPYYTASLPIWLDEITTTAEWHAEFCKPEAKQVVDAIGAWIICFNNDASLDDVETDLKAIQEVIEHHCDGSNEAVMLAVATGAAALSSSRSVDLEDLTIQYGFELIDQAATGRNEFGERQGIQRLREALEANDWTSTTGDPDDILDELDEEDFAEFEAADMDADLSRLKAALLDDVPATATTDELSDTVDQGAAVDDLGVMLGKLLAVREQSADLPLAQRKRLAAKAVRDLMK